MSGHGDSLLLIDTAWEVVVTSELLRRIERVIGLPVDRAIITHFHYDRIAGVDLLERSGVEGMVHSMTQKLMAEQGGPVPNGTLAGLDVPGGTVTIGKVEVMHPGPGHAPDNLMVWLPGQRVLFVGCAIRAMDAQLLGNTADADLTSWPKAVRRVQEHYPQAKVVVPGHGKVGGPELLSHTLRLFEKEN